MKPLTLADSQFSTDSLKLAAFLLASGLPLTGSRYTPANKLVVFFFSQSPHLVELELAFQNNAPIGVQDLCAAQDTLWKIIQKKRKGD